MKQLEYKMIGELLVAAGLISEEQRDEILSIQEESCEAFGALVRRHFNISGQAIESVWMDQIKKIGALSDTEYLQLSKMLSC